MQHTLQSCRNMAPKRCHPLSPHLPSHKLFLLQIFPVFFHSTLWFLFICQVYLSTSHPIWKTKPGILPFPCCRQCWSCPLLCPFLNVNLMFMDEVFENAGIRAYIQYGAGVQQRPRLNEQSFQLPQTSHSTLSALLPQQLWNYSVFIFLHLQSSFLPHHEKRKRRQLWSDKALGEGFLMWALTTFRTG